MRVIDNSSYDGRRKAAIFIAALDHPEIITPESEPEITVDNIEVAQFIYLLLSR